VKYERCTDKCLSNFDCELCNKQVSVDFITEDEAVCARANSSYVSFSGFLAVIEVSHGITARLSSLSLNVCSSAQICVCTDIIPFTI
jgi:hypothetical protein